MCNDKDPLDQIASEIGEITDEQNSDTTEDDPAREGPEFDPDEYRRDREDEYEGNR